MKFSDTTNKDGCIQYIESLTRLGDGGITNDTTLFKQITSYFNQADKKVAMALLRSDRRWKYDDSNYTDFPIATIDAVATQRDYTLPASTSGGNASTLWRVTQVRYKVTGGLFKKLDLMEIDEQETVSTTTGVPTRYKLIGNSIRLDVIPVASSTGGLEITFQRSGVAFTTASTTAQPGYIDTYHDLPCYDTAATYLMPINTQLAITYSNMFTERVKLLQQDRAMMNDDVPRRLEVRRESNK